VIKEQKKSYTRCARLFVIAEDYLIKQ